MRQSPTRRSPPQSNRARHQRHCLPRRANGVAYKGINTVALWAAALERGFDSPYWLTFKQAQALKASVRKGEHEAYVFYCGDRQARDDDADDAAADVPLRQRVLRSYTVFCADQIDGLPAQYRALAAAPAPLSERETALLADIERIPPSCSMAATAPTTPRLQTKSICQRARRFRALVLT